MTSLIEARSIWRKHARNAAGIRRARCTVCSGTQAYSRLSRSLETTQAAAAKWFSMVCDLETRDKQPVLKLH